MLVSAQEVEDGDVEKSDVQMLAPDATIPTAKPFLCVNHVAATVHLLED